ncbi:MAG: hypothetical protein K8I04_00775 [Gammaproteobacteria bacterium]|nr:hypothetical protein [Gammaproteobacteria bacterium]
MNTKTLAVGGVLLLCAAGPVQADKTLAHSKSLGMSFTALGDPWCAPTVQLRVDAEDVATYASPDYGTTLQKLGQVLSRECPQAATITITGVAAGKSVWSGVAARESGWLAQQTPSQTPPVTAAVPSAPAVPVPLATHDGTTSTPAVTASATTAGAAAAPPQSVPDSPVATAEGALVIAGWQPGGHVMVGEGAGKMTEITSQETGCNLYTFIDVKPEFKPTFSARHEYTCKNGYIQTTDFKRSSVTNLLYQGQKQPFASMRGFWHDGYNLDRGLPKQIISRYRLTSKDQRNRSSTVDRLLVWVGEDRALRTHYFTTYTHSDPYKQWRWDQYAPFIVLTDNTSLQQGPEATRLADSLVEMYAAFSGSKQFNVVNFVITDKMHTTPTHAYELASKQADPDPSFYKAGHAVHHRGMPWTVEVSSDFVAKRAAFVEAARQRAEMEQQREAARAEAERQRAEIERQRQAALRAQHQKSLDQQHLRLAQASRYDRLRFYATLMLEGARMERGKVDFSARQVRNLDPFSQAVALTHPAQYLRLAQNGEVAIGSPLYLLIKADDGEIEKPYPMQVGYNETSQEIDGWMLIRAAPKFNFSFSEDGEPIFVITIQEAVTCKSDQCLDEMDAEALMKAWYDDDRMNFAAIGTN